MKDGPLYVLIALFIIAVLTTGCGRMMPYTRSDGPRNTTERVIKRDLTINPPQAPAAGKGVSR